MNVITFIESSADLDLCLRNDIKEVILTHQQLSRQSRLNTDSFVQLAKQARDSGVRVILEWDIIPTENEFSSQLFQDLAPLVDGVRVQDIGVANFVLEHSELPMQLNLETGNHNLVGIQAWEQYFGARLERLILSIELNIDCLREYQQKLKTPIEILAWGRILLFYTPRKLLSIDDRFEFIDNFIEVSGTSEESPHKGFPIVENQHGTFMYHIKDLFLFDVWDQLQTLPFIRIDLRHRELALVAQLRSILANGNAQQLKQTLAPHSIRGYFLTNKSDVLFKKLKNHRTQRHDDHYLGEVMESAKDKYMALNLKHTGQLAAGTEVVIKNPDGKEKIVQLNRLTSTSGQAHELVSAGLYLTDYVSGIWVKSQIYRKKAQGESSLAL